MSPFKFQYILLYFIQIRNNCIKVKTNNWSWFHSEYLETLVKLKKLYPGTYWRKHSKKWILHIHIRAHHSNLNTIKTTFNIFIYLLNTRMSDTGISIVGRCGTSRSSIPDERMTLVRYNERNKSIVHGHCSCNRTQSVSNVNVHLYTCS